MTVRVVELRKVESGVQVNLIYKYLGVSNVR